MKISQYLRNVITNFPVGHYRSDAALQYLDAALDAEKRCDSFELVNIAETFGLNLELLDIWDFIPEQTDSE